MMKMRLGRMGVLVALSTWVAGGARAYELNLGTNLPPADFHGFLSQGFLDSSSYNYLGDTTRGSFLFTEAGLNAAVNPLPRTRITAQAFTYDVGQNVGKYDLLLDYALVEYTVNNDFGVRAGRIRRPQGIYNSIQDLDLARTFVLLPQGLYDARWRDFYVSLDGGEFFGDIPLGNAGDLSYEAFGGVINPSMDGGVAQAVRSSLPSVVRLDAVDSFPEAGAQLWWNTPVNGLRVGAAGGYSFNFRFHTTAFGAHAASISDVPLAQGSLEYVWNAWTFQAEYLTYILEPHTGGSTRTEAWYVSATHRLNKWFETGAYYTEYYGDVGERGDSKLYQKDAAIALRFDPTPWWIFKIEGHCINGTGLLDDNASNPPANQDDRLWFLGAVKTTFYF